MSESENESRIAATEEHDEIEDKEEGLNSEEEGDLFGDDDDEEQNQSIIAPSRDEDDDEENPSEDDRDLKEMEVSIPRHTTTLTGINDLLSVKVPVFLSVEPTPFDPEQFKEAFNAKDKQEEADDKLINENTIRWRYAHDGSDNIYKQSNAHFVEWDDGSLSLKIGNEIFDIVQRPIEDQFLVISHEKHEVLQTDSLFTKSANLVPSSTTSTTHTKLTQAVMRRQKKSSALNIVIDRDPMEVQRLAEEKDRQADILRRRRLQKLRLEEERVERTPSPGYGNTARGSRGQEQSYERFERNYANEYEDDGFIIDDEEDDEYDEGAERLKKLKAQGAAKYKRSRNDEEEEEEDEEEEEEDEEEEVVSRKKRRVIDDDEDDE